MASFYHYTSLQSFRDIVDGRASGWKGLKPIRRLLPLPLSAMFNLPEKSEHGAVFGLLEPQPQSWMVSQYHKGRGLLETVIGDISRSPEIILLKCDVVPSDDIYVADHIFHMADDYNGREDLDNPATARVKTNYWNSLVPFFEYQGQHKVPEVICFTAIPLERIQVVGRYNNRIDLYNQLRGKVGYEPLLK